NVDVDPNKLSRDFGIPPAAPLRIRILNREIATFDPAELTQPLHKSSDSLAFGRRGCGPQVPYGRQLARLLRARRERPGSRRAANKRDELAAFHLRDHSITSSARASSVGGKLRPRPFAILRWSTNSNLPGAWTGSPPGFSPWRMRST